MANRKVVESITFSGEVAGGSFKGHSVRVTAERQGRKYYPHVCLSAPGGGPIGLNDGLPNASLNAGWDTPDGALDAGFKAFYFYLNSKSSQTRVINIEQSSVWWIELDESGKRVYNSTMNMTPEEAEAWRNEKYEYTPPDGQGKRVRTEIGVSRTADGARSKVDGVEAADTGLANFLKTQGMEPTTGKGQAIGTKE